MPLPSFIKSGLDGKVLAGGGNFLRLEAGKPVRVVLLTDVVAPPGEEPSGTNSVISFNRYTLWLSEAERGDGKMSPNFVQLGGKSDPGLLLGLEPKFCALATVAQLPSGPITPDTELQEVIWQMGIGLYKQLCTLREAVGDSVQGMIVSIKRTGEGKLTRYELTNTGKRIELAEKPTTNLEDLVGPTTREGIVKLLAEAGHWPPEGGDPYAEVKPTLKTKPAGKLAKPAATPIDSPASEAEADLPPADDADEFENIDE